MVDVGDVDEDYVLLGVDYFGSCVEFVGFDFDGGQVVVVVGIEWCCVLVGEGQYQYMFGVVIGKVDCLLQQGLELYVVFVQWLVVVLVVDVDQQVDEIEWVLGCGCINVGVQFVGGLVGGGDGLWVGQCYILCMQGGGQLVWLVIVDGNGFFDGV